MERSAGSRRRSFANLDDGEIGENESCERNDHQAEETALHAAEHVSEDVLSTFFNHKSSWGLHEISVICVTDKKYKRPFITNVFTALFSQF